MTRARLMVLDTASLYFRAFYGVPTSVRAPDGTPINAVRGLLDFIARLAADHQPTHLIAAWDNDWRPEFRVAAIPSYKEHRVLADAIDPDSEDVPDELEPQVPLIEEALELIGIKRIGVDGFEADDVIGSIVTTSDAPSFVVTGDRDLFQLVDDVQPIRVLYTASRGVGNAEVMDEAAIVAKYGVRPNQYADFALLRGDSSDGLPGVKGIGEKTAAALLEKYATLDELIVAVQAGQAGVKASAAQAIRNSLDYIEAAKKVVPVVRTLPVDLAGSEVPLEPHSPVGLRDFATQWGLVGAVDRLASVWEWNSR